MAKVTSRLQVTLPKSARLKLFDRATSRQQSRQQAEAVPGRGCRGWTREELYEGRDR